MTPVSFITMFSRRARRRRRKRAEAKGWVDKRATWTRRGALLLLLLLVLPEGCCRDAIGTEDEEAGDDKLMRADFTAGLEGSIDRVVLYD